MTGFVSQENGKRPGFLLCLWDPERPLPDPRFVVPWSWTSVSRPGRSRRLWSVRPSPRQCVLAAERSRSVPGGPLALMTSLACLAPGQSGPWAAYVLLPEAPGPLGARPSSGHRGGGIRE